MSLWVPRLCQLSVGPTALGKAANPEYSPAPLTLPQPLCLQRVSTLCRASKNDVLNTARAEALNQINSFLILRAFESPALLEDC